MAIGEQPSGSSVVTDAQLRDTYENVLKEAIQQAYPGIEVSRSDDVAAPGTITTDILTRLMHSTFVVADITYPNPNVFYELGIRHACRPGTILVRDKNAPHPAPFDVSQQRYIDYEQTPAGVKALAARLHERFVWYEKNPGEPDNQLLSLAKLIKFSFPQYSQPDTLPTDLTAEFLTTFITTPGLMRAACGDKVDFSQHEDTFKVLAANPEATKEMLKVFLRLGGNLAGLPGK
jgi:hypothetical protein